MNGTKFSSRISLLREAREVCRWDDSASNTGACGDLIVDKVDGLIIYNATFHKALNKNYETYTWGTASRQVSVTLDWNNMGEAPEVKACGLHDEQSKIFTQMYASITT
ncbi:unnamed protein product [Hymenolepis diminuta]|nr:unnamed protein product [Hymenolepis diminuta]